MIELVIGFMSDTQTQPIQLGVLIGRYYNWFLTSEPTWVNHEQWGVK